MSHSTFKQFIHESTETAKERALRQFDDSISRHNKKRDTQTSTEDMIISEFEQGNLTYTQAKSQLVAMKSDVWIHELNMAAELISDKKNNH